jgi:mannosyltransferase OCH1-like enzyme
LNRATVMTAMAMHKKYLYGLLAGTLVFVFLVGQYSHASLSQGANVAEPIPPQPESPAPTAPTAPTAPAAPNTPEDHEPAAAKLFPSKIWQSWKDDSEDPTDRTVGFPHKWREVNPSWRYERITNANIDAYVKDNFDSSISDVFSSVSDNILKADFLRYLILLREGGVWADIDVRPHQPIDKWIPEQYKDQVNLVIGIENDHHKRPIWPNLPYSVQLCQYTVLAKPNHPAIRTLVEHVRKGLEELISHKEGAPITFEDVMSTTGPFAFTQVLMDYFTEQTGVKHTGDELNRLPEPVLIGDVLVLPKDSFGWLPQEHTHEEGDPSILVEHLFIGSWREGHPG